MKIEPAGFTDVVDVARNMRERDFAEFSAVSWQIDKESLAHDLGQRYGNRPDVMCGWWNDKPTCIGGVIIARPNVATLLFLATDDFGRIAFPVTKWIKKELFPRLQEAGIHRFEAVSLAANTESHSWLRVLGLTPETKPMKGYGRSGEAFIQFAWVPDVRPAGN